MLNVTQYGWATGIRRLPAEFPSAGRAIRWLDAAPVKAPCWVRCRKSIGSAASPALRSREFAMLVAESVTQEARPYRFAMNSSMLRSSPACLMIFRRVPVAKSPGCLGMGKGRVPGHCHISWFPPCRTKPHPRSERRFLTSPGLSLGRKGSLAASEDCFEMTYLALPRALSVKPRNRYFAELQIIAFLAAGVGVIDA